mgnify:FL=1|jgi:hypothetical protein
MAIKPILFNTEMVRAILDGRKTCTRRICKDANECTVPDMEFYNADRRTYAVHNFADKEHAEQLSIAERTCPICPGDILYVRETWQYLYELDGNEQVIEDTGKYYYAATDTIPFDAYVDENGVTHDHTPWHPSIHMPKEAARIWLKVTDVRVERLQEITENGAKAEGAIDNRGFIHSPENEYDRIHTAREHFIKIWNSTIKKSDLDRYSWDVNPYVWVIEFERCEKPETKVN